MKESLLLNRAYTIMWQEKFVICLNKMHSKLRKIPFYPLGKLLLITFQNGGVSFRRIPVFILFLLRYTLFEPFRLTEILLFERKIRKHELQEDPIFILGHWRSGTTHLQELLEADSNHTTISVYQFLFIDHFILTERWLKPPMNAFCRIFKIPYSFQRVTMNLNMPGELESAMCAGLSDHSYTWGHIFPKRYEYWFSRMIGLKRPKDQEGWLDDYDFLIKKISFASGGKRVIVKSPGDTGRANHLLKRYPKAKFVFIERDPISVYHSTMYFWRVIQKEVSFQKVNDEQLQGYCINSYIKLKEAYHYFRKQIPSEQLYELTFKELISEPMETLNRIYDELELGVLPLKQVEQKLILKRDHQKVNYTTSPELARDIEEKWESIQPDPNFGSDETSY